MADREHRAAQVRRFQEVQRQVKYLGVRLRARIADELRSCLRKLTVRATISVIVAEHWTAIAKSRGAGIGLPLAATW